MQAPVPGSALVSHPLPPQGVVGSDGAPGAKGNVVCVLMRSDTLTLGPPIPLSTPMIPRFNFPDTSTP